VAIPADTTNIRVMVSVGNDVRAVFFNGRPLSEHTLGTSSVTHEECPILDEFRFDVPPELILTGSNLVAFQVVDRGVESFFDARILAELSPDQLLEAVVVQQAPLVPVRDVVVDARIDPNGAQSSATITYAVAATREFGEIRLEQISADTLTVASFLGGERMALSTATPDGITMARSSRAAERLADLEPGILSIPSILVHPTTFEGLFRFDTILADVSCEEACSRRAEATSTAISLAGSIRSGSCSNFFGMKQKVSCDKARGLFSISEARAHQSLPESLVQCITRCIARPVPPLPPPPPAPLNGALMFDPASIRPQSVSFSGQLVQGLGGPGDRTFGYAVGQLSTDLLTPGRVRSIGLSVSNLTAGTWTVTADIGFGGNILSGRLQLTCDDVMVPGELLRMQVSDILPEGGCVQGDRILKGPTFQ
jgi:hypothetical protein